MTKRVSITLNDAQEGMLQSYADAMGMSLAYAARMAMLRDLMDWHAKTSPRSSRSPRGPCWRTSIRSRRRRDS